MLSFSDARRPLMHLRAPLLAVATLGALWVPMLLAGCNTAAPTTDTASGTDTGTSGAASPSGDKMSAQNGNGGDSAGATLSIEGSDTLLKLAQQWAQDFQTENPASKITVTGGGSGQGIKSLLSGSATIANASRQVDDKEKAQAKAAGFELVETPVCRDGITIVVNPKNPVKSLTLAQLKDIYTGKATNWKQVGGADVAITPSGRETTSGTYKYFQEDVLQKEKYRADMASTPSNPAIANNVAQQAGGVGYIGVAYATEYVKAGKVKEVLVSFAAGQPPLLPTEDNILTGKYPISRALYNYTKNAPTGLAKQYLDYVTGPEGQKTVESQGYVPLKK